MSELSPRVKVCGITRVADAELAVQLGAWAVGMVFYEPSPRRCSLEEAQRITSALRRRVQLCGVFVNAPLEQMLRTSEDLGLTMLQLHGDEGPLLCGELARRSGTQVVKAAQVSDVGDIRDLERYHVDYHLLDARSAAPGRQDLRGGTGETFDWRLLAERRSSIPLILSGGLDPENVGEAIAACTRHHRRGAPYAVDTASGTEAAPGRKDPDKLQAFFAEVQRAALGAPA
jgi:phosphoribosylanthranilate isomerase